MKVTLQSIWCVLIVATTQLYGQDVQFSQFYNAPLYLNPALTGTSHSSRAIINYRNQWPIAGKPFVTYAASFDHFFSRYSSGVGIMAMQSKEGTSKLKSTEISGFYSYHIGLNETWTLIPGLQATFVQQNIDYSKVIFPDQYDNNGFLGNTSEPLNYSRRHYVDFSSGGILYSEVFWFGFAYHHINRPRQSFVYDGTNNRLPSELNFHAGAKIPVASSARGRSTRIKYKEKAVIPSILYKTQGKFDQLDLGFNVLVEPVQFGIWYRGLPIKRYEQGLTNAEAVIGLIGVAFNGFSFCYSYDFVVSRLNRRTGGAHEISLIYLFGEDDSKGKKKPKYKRLPCPSFYRL